MNSTKSTVTAFFIASLLVHAAPGAPEATDGVGASCVYQKAGARELKRFIEKPD